MFESDDFDQVLSQLDLPEEGNKKTFTRFSDDVPNNFNCNIQKNSNKVVAKGSTSASFSNKNIDSVQRSRPHDIERNLVQITNVSPQHCKRKIIKSHFDTHCKRKFPGPAGLLTGNFEEYKNDDDVGHVELLSQDIDFSQNPIHRGLFESTLWKKLLQDLNMWNINSIENIKSIKQPAVDRNFKCRKAKTITAFVECVDRSAMDPLVILRDLTGNIKCTLHRDAWSHFSSYIVPECCALILCKPTVLTTGSTFKKHYLNITLDNILAVYSSIIVQNEEKLPDAYEKITHEDCTVFRKENHNEDLHQPLQSEQQVSTNSQNDFFEDLDSVFSDEIF